MPRTPVAVVEPRTPVAGVPRIPEAVAVPRTPVAAAPRIPVVAAPRIQAAAAVLAGNHTGRYSILSLPMFIHQSRTVLNEGVYIYYLWR